MNKKYTKDNGLNGNNGVSGEPGIGGLYGATAVESKKSESVKRSARERRGGGGGTRTEIRHIYVTVPIPKYINTNIERKMILSTKRAPPGNKQFFLNNKDIKFPVEIKKIPIKHLFDNYVLNFPEISKKFKIQKLINFNLFDKMNDGQYVKDILDFYENDTVDDGSDLLASN